MAAVVQQGTDEKSPEKVFIPENMGDGVRNAKYAVRGAIVKRAYEIQADLIDCDKDKYPFSSIVFCNIGNPQAFISPPITFHRQVLACTMYPPLMKEAKLLKFPADVVTRAQRILNSTAHQNIGAYTNSQGLLTVRQSVAAYLKRRDGFDADPTNMFLTNGASAGITYCIQCLGSRASDGILIPLPQYPLYSAQITLNGGTAVPYFLDENADWSASLDSIEAAVIKARGDGLAVRAIVIINPGNPTGHCFSRECIDGIIALAAKYAFVVLADEVYQENIYFKDSSPFVSFRKCLLSNADYASTVELISFHSVSKGIFGECGLRGGYMECVNIDESGRAMLVKLASINLCPNTPGQVMVDIMTAPPIEGDESYAQFKAEYETQYESLKERAAILTRELNQIKGISCNTVFGAMYAFPSVVIPDAVAERAVAAYAGDARLTGKPVDFVYCWELLEKCGVCVIPGSGFGQKEGSYHFRTTLLPPKKQIQFVVGALAKFHELFIETYSK